MCCPREWSKTACKCPISVIFSEAKLKRALKSLRRTCIYKLVSASHNHADLVVVIHSCVTKLADLLPTSISLCFSSCFTCPLLKQCFIVSVNEKMHLNIHLYLFMYTKECIRCLIYYPKMLWWVVCVQDLFRYSWVATPK